MALRIKVPAPPLPAGYMPSGGVPHRVGDGESWLSLAAGCGVDPGWLIQFNFETRDPAEVNWYLQNRVGCQRKTADGYNLMFSAAASPGIVYLPRPQLVRSLSNLAYAKYGIVIKGSEDYQAQVQATLNWIARSDTGMVLLQALGRTGKTITISPYDGVDCNATAGAVDWIDATAAGETLFAPDGGFNPITSRSRLEAWLDLPGEPVRGSGRGSDVVVRFSPAMFGHGASGACAGVSGAPGSSPSQVLFHELAHAYREASGTFNRRPTVGGSAVYTDMEEFFAVVVTNVLIADPSYASGNRTLRADHSGFAPLAAPLCTSHGFAAHDPNRNKLRELVVSDPAFVREIGAVGSRFNPFVELP